MMKMRSVFLVGWLVAAGASTLQAQVSVDPATERAAGISAANRESLAVYYLAGAIGGTGIGITSAHYVRADRAETPYLYGGLGLGVLFGAGVTIHVSGRSQGIPFSGAAETTAFDQAYRDRLKDRRQAALGIGALVGIGVGVLIHVMAPRGT